MPNHSRVVWSEGLFMQPQHLQQHDRYLENLIINRPNSVGFHSWGIVDFEIDHRLLALGKFGLTTCKGILPDGTAFDIPAEDYAPSPIDIPVGTTNSYIYLALPIKRAGLPEVAIHEEHPSCRYHCETQEISDNNAGINVSTPIQVGRLSLKFLLEHEERGGYCYIVIAKIKESLADKQIKLDEQFIPPCLDIHAVPKLLNFVQELLSLLHYRGEALSANMTEAGHGGISEVADFMLLQLINRTQAIIDFFANKKGIHPEVLFAHLIQLSAEIATFTCKTRRLNKPPLYHHENLQVSFDPVIRDLRQALTTVLEQNAIALPLELRKYGIWVSPIVDRSLLQEADLILAIHAELPPETLKISFTAQAKIGSIESIQSLISRALPGIDLQVLTVIPRQLPYNTGFIYFTLNKHHELWQELASSAGIAIHIGNEFPGLELQLWAVRR